MKSSCSASPATLNNLFASLGFPLGIVALGWTRDTVEIRVVEETVAERAREIGAGAGTTGRAAPALVFAAVLTGFPATDRDRITVGPEPAAARRALSAAEAGLAVGPAVGADIFDTGGLETDARIPVLVIGRLIAAAVAGREEEVEPGAGVLEVVRGTGVGLATPEGTLELREMRGPERVADRPMGRVGTVVGREGPGRAEDALVVVVRVAILDSGRNWWKGSSSSPTKNTLVSIQKFEVEAY